MQRSSIHNLAPFKPGISLWLLYHSLSGPGFQASVNPLLSSLLGDMNGRLLQNKRQIMGLLLRQIRLDWVMVAKRNVRSEEILRLTWEQDKRADEFSRMMRLFLNSELS